MSSHDPFSDVDDIPTLAARGLTADEIAVQLGMSVDAVRQAPGYVSAPLTDAHDARVERALWERAAGSVTWSESITKLGELVRLEKRLDPDVAAAKLYLQARKPQRWGNAPSETARVYVVALPAVARNANDWLEGIAQDAAPKLLRVAIEGASATGGEGGDGAGVERE